MAGRRLCRDNRRIVKPSKFTFLSWQDVNNACLSIYSRMTQDNYKPQSLVGLLRGGVVPARIFSDCFDILLDFSALDVKLYTGINERMDEAVVGPFMGDVKGKSILIIDDIWDSGKTMEAVLDHLQEEDVKTATMVWKETAKRQPDYFDIVARNGEWIVFPWETYEFQRQISR